MIRQIRADREPPVIIDRLAGSMPLPDEEAVHPPPAQKKACSLDCDLTPVSKAPEIDGRDIAHDLREPKFVEPCTPASETPHAVADTFYYTTFRVPWEADASGALELLREAFGRVQPKHRPPQPVNTLSKPIGPGRKEVAFIFPYVSDDVNLTADLGFPLSDAMVSEFVSQAGIAHHRRALVSE